MQMLRLLFKILLLGLFYWNGFYWNFLKSCCVLKKKKILIILPRIYFNSLKNLITFTDEKEL